MNTLHERLKHAMAGPPKVSQAALARACGIKPPSVHDWLSGKTKTIEGQNLLVAAELLKVSPMWLATGKGPMRKGVASSEGGKSADGDHKSSAADKVMALLRKHAGGSLGEDAQQKIADAVAESLADDTSPALESAEGSVAFLRKGEIRVPQYDVRASMGHGQLPADYKEVVRNLIVSEDVLKEKGVTYTSPASLALISGWGQSMEGTINDKDPVIVDRGVTEFVGDGIYVLTWHDLLYIKRLQMHDTEHFDMISDHPNHKDRVVPVRDVTIHAKVLLIWNARKT